MGLLVICVAFFALRMMVADNKDLEVIASKVAGIFKDKLQSKSNNYQRDKKIIN
jgi:hypothetical protein